VGSQRLPLELWRGLEQGLKQVVQPANHLAFGICLRIRMDTVIVTNLRFLRSLFIDVIPDFGLLHSVLVGDVAEISEILSVIIFRLYSEDRVKFYLRNVDNIIHNLTV
jgi:hypothetical protein